MGWIAGTEIVYILEGQWAFGVNRFCTILIQIDFLRVSPGWYIKGRKYWRIDYRKWETCTCMNKPTIHKDHIMYTNSLVV